MYIVLDTPGGIQVQLLFVQHACYVGLSALSNTKQKLQLLQLKPKAVERLESDLPASTNTALALGSMPGNLMLPSRLSIFAQELIF